MIYFSLFIPRIIQVRSNQTLGLTIPFMLSLGNRSPANDLQLQFQAPIAPACPANQTFTHDGAKHLCHQHIPTNQTPNHHVANRLHHRAAPAVVMPLAPVSMTLYPSALPLPVAACA